MFGIQMLDKNESHPGFLGELLQEFDKSLEPPRRGAQPNNRKAFSFERSFLGNHWIDPPPGNWRRMGHLIILLLTAQGLDTPMCCFRGLMDLIRFPMKVIRLL